MHPRPPSSIRARLILLVLAVWLPAAAGLALQARATYRHEESVARDSLRQLAQSLNFAIETELDKKAVLARVLAVSPSLRARDMASFDREARMATAGSSDAVLLVDRDRLHLFTAQPTPQPVRRVEGAPFVTEGPAVHFSPRGPLSGRPVIALYVPEAGGRPPQFNVGVPFPPQEVQALIARQEVPDGGVAAVIDGQQRVMGRSRDPERWIGTTASVGELRQMAQQGRAGFVRSTTLDGITSLTYLDAPNRYGWAALVALPQATLQQSARRLALQAIAVSATLLVSGLVLALVVARRIARPVRALEEAAGELLAQRVPAPLRTGLAEADEVGAVLHDAGVRARESGRLLEMRVTQAVGEAQEAQARLFEARKHEAIGRLTGGVAHDFNNLLQTIQMGLQVVQRSVGEGRHSRPLQAALAACGKAADQVRQLLAFGRAQPLQPRAVALADLLLRSSELTERALGERIRLLADLEPGLPPVFADPNQLELALLNLVFNARDAMPHGGTVTVRGRADGDASGPGRFVRVEVADDGEGMDAETLARVFEPYFTTKPVGAGSGLGLPQVQAFARQSGGDVHIASTPGQGTRVTLVLPVADADAPAADADLAAPAPDTALPPLRILLVEDDLLVGSVVPTALEQDGHQVTWCRSGDEAVGLLRQEAEFDVLFTDLVMPGRLTGAELVGWVRRNRPDMPAVVATGYSAQQPDPRVAVLRKPYSIDDLLAALRAALQSHAGAPPSSPAA